MQTKRAIVTKNPRGLQSEGQEGEAPHPPLKAREWTAQLKHENGKAHHQNHAHALEGKNQLSYGLKHARVLVIKRMKIHINGIARAHLNGREQTIVLPDACAHLKARERTIVQTEADLEGIKQTIVPTEGGAHVKARVNRRTDSSTRALARNRTKNRTERSRRAHVKARERTILPKIVPHERAQIEGGKNGGTCHKRNS